MRVDLSSAMRSHLVLIVTGMIVTLVTVGIPFFSIWVRARWKGLGFYPYVGSYLVVLGLLLALYPERRPGHVLSLWKFTLWSALAGYVASVIAYVGLAFVPSGLSRLARSFVLSPGMFLLAPTFLLLWLYGGLVGLVTGLLSRLRI